MSDGGLNIVIGADVKSAVSGVNDLQRKISELYAKLDEAKSRQSLLINPKNIADAQKQINGITKEIDKLESNHGFDNLGKSAKGVLGPINNVYGAVRKIAYALPGVGIAGIFGAAFAGAAALIESYTSASNEAAKAQEKLNASLGESTSKAQGQAVALADLASVALDTSNSTKTRTGALQKLQSEYPGYFKNLSIEKSSYEDLQKALDQVTAALVRQAQIKGLESTIEETYKNLNKTVAEGGTTFEKVTANVSGFVAALTNTNVSDLGKFGDFFDKAKKASLSHSLGEDARQAQNQVDILNNKLKELLKTSIESGDDKKLDKKLNTSKPQQDDTLRFLEETKKNLEAISKTDLRPVFQRFNDSALGAFNTLNADILKKKIEKALSDGAKGGVSKSNISALIDSLKGLFDKTANANLRVPVTVTPVIDKTEDPSKALEKQFSKLDKGAAIHLTIGGFNQDEVQKALDEAAALAARINRTLAQGIGSSIENFGESLGSSIAKGVSPLKAAGDSILQAVGGLIESMGKALIQYGIVKTGLDAILKGGIAIPGVAALALGAAAVAIGALVKNLSGVHAFAEGGIITGPTLGLVGEKGPEVIFPLSKLQQFVKGNTQGAAAYIPDVHLKGQDLVIAFMRAQKNNRLV